MATNITFAAITGGTASIFMGLSPLVPFTLGGVAIYSYKVAKDELDLNIKTGIGVIGAAILLGYLTSGLLTPFAITLTEYFGVDMTAVTGPDVLDSFEKTIGFTLGSLATSIFVRLFDGRTKIVDEVLKKTTGIDFTNKEKENKE